MKIAEVVKGKGSGLGSEEGGEEAVGVGWKSH